jgi:hypothetical protein
MIETWKPIVGFEGLYEVSSWGQVKSLPRQTARGVRGGGLVTPYLKQDGYLEVYLYKRAKRTHKLVHHAVLEAFVGPRPQGQETLHGPGGKTDNRICNLQWGTRSQNMGEDRARDHQTNRGEHHGNSKVTWEQVCEIRAKYVPYIVTLDMLAEEYSLNRGAVHDIVKFKNWKYPPARW